MTKYSFQEQLLPGRAAVRITGAEALPFLHNLLTCEMEGLKPGQASYGALLSPQGKILHDVFVMAATDGALIDCDATQVEELLKKLALYKLRAKLTIHHDAGLEVAVSSDPMPDGFPDPRLASMGWRAIRPKGLTAPGAGYDAIRMLLGLADSSEIESNKLFPHEANFDQINGVSFKKGCYVGQEVVSRMQHRGTARNRILPVACDGDAPPKGSPVQSGDAVIGEIMGAVGDHALALLRLDRLAEAQQPLLSHAVRVRVQKPDWIGYDVTIPEVAQ